MGCCESKDINANHSRNQYSSDSTATSSTHPNTIDVSFKTNQVETPATFTKFAVLAKSLTSDAFISQEINTKIWPTPPYTIGGRSLQKLFYLLSSNKKVNQKFVGEFIQNEVPALLVRNLTGEHHDLIDWSLQVSYITNKQYPEIRQYFRTEAWLQVSSNLMKGQGHVQRYILAINLLRLFYKNDKAFIQKVTDFENGKILKRLIKHKQECENSMSFYSIVRALRDLLFVGNQVMRSTVRNIKRLRLWKSLGDDNSINQISFEDIDITIIEKVQAMLDQIRKIHGVQRRASSDYSLFMHMVQSKSLRALINSFESNSGIISIPIAGINAEPPNTMGALSMYAFAIKYKQVENESLSEIITDAIQKLSDALLKREVNKQIYGAIALVAMIDNIEVRMRIQMIPSAILAILHCLSSRNEYAIGNALLALGKLFENVNVIDKVLMSHRELFIENLVSSGGYLTEDRFILAYLQVIRQVYKTPKLIVGRLMRMKKLKLMDLISAKRNRAYVCENPSVKYQTLMLIEEIVTDCKTYEASGEEANIQQVTKFTPYPHFKTQHSLTEQLQIANNAAILLKIIVNRPLIYNKCPTLIFGTIVNINYTVQTHYTHKQYDREIVRQLQTISAQSVIYISQTIRQQLQHMLIS